MSFSSSSSTEIAAAKKAASCTPAPLKEMGCTEPPHFDAAASWNVGEHAAVVGGSIKGKSTFVQHLAHTNGHKFDRVIVVHTSGVNDGYFNMVASKADLISCGTTDGRLNDTYECSKKINTVFAQQQKEVDVYNIQSRFAQDRGSDMVPTPPRLLVILDHLPRSVMVSDACIRKWMEYGGLLYTTVIFEAQRLQDILPVYRRSVQLFTFFGRHTKSEVFKLYLAPVCAGDDEVTDSDGDDEVTDNNQEDDDEGESSSENAAVGFKKACAKLGSSEFETIMKSVRSNFGALVCDLHEQAMYTYRLDAKEFNATTSGPYRVGDGPKFIKRSPVFTTAATSGSGGKSTIQDAGAHSLYAAVEEPPLFNVARDWDFDTYSTVVAGKRGVGKTAFTQTVLRDHGHQFERVVVVTQTTAGARKFKDILPDAAIVISNVRQRMDRIITSQVVDICEYQRRLDELENANNYLPPRLLVVIDCPTPDTMKESWVRDLNVHGKSNYITTITEVQSLRIVPPPIRKNADLLVWFGCKMPSVMMGSTSDSTAVDAPSPSYTRAEAKDIAKNDEAFKFEFVGDMKPPAYANMMRQVTRDYGALVCDNRQRCRVQLSTLRLPATDFDEKGSIKGPYCVGSSEYRKLDQISPSMRAMLA